MKILVLRLIETSIILYNIAYCAAVHGFIDWKRSKKALRALWLYDPRVFKYLYF